MILVGVAGAVPHFSDYDRHVRLGDIVVSYPLGSRQASYLHCQSVRKATQPGSYEFEAKMFVTEKAAMSKSLEMMNRGGTTDSYMHSALERNIREGQKLLRDEDGISFERPLAKTDRLYMEDECAGKVHVEHPKPIETGNATHAGQPRIHYGLPSGGKYVGCDYDMRLQFAQVHKVLCYDNDCHAILEAVETNGKTSYVIIRSMSDYIDGRRNLDWQPYAALSASAYMKILIKQLDTVRF